MFPNFGRRFGRRADRRFLQCNLVVDFETAPGNKYAFYIEINLIKSRIPILPWRSIPVTTSQAIGTGLDADSRLEEGIWFGVTDQGSGHHDRFSLDGPF